MRSLPFIAILMLIAGSMMAQSPHGSKLKIDCAVCHTTGAWKYSAETSKFSHDKQTNFILEGQHRLVNCKNCHKTLIFSEAQTTCISCHTDMHNATVGGDCARCHDSDSWIIENVTEIHQRSRFPLLGAHNNAECSACHTSVSKLEFQPLGINCIDCHQQDFLKTTKPNHQSAGFSQNCFDCHNIDAQEWSATGFNHNFFPLTKGHKITDCEQCHGNNILVPVSKECFSCHQQDYNQTKNPKHQQPVFSTNCNDCHSTNPDWRPATFETHDQYFPINSGTHGGAWDKCTDCHSQPSNFSAFKCTDCHEHEISRMDKEHKDIPDYSSNSNACFACHPQGNKRGSFDHNKTGFILTGAHNTTGCIKCHSNGYAGTLNDCNSCHTANYNQAANPNHTQAGISKDCETCHTTAAWKPSPFNHTNTGFALDGAHAGRQCSECHVGTTGGASPDCFACHQQNYNQAPNHLTLGYPHECTQCHDVTNWEKSEFDHNKTSFPLSGQHNTTTCGSCHTSGFAGTPKDCNSCHTKNYNQAANPNHSAAGIPVTCESCHTPAAWAPSLFNHTNTGFALDGAHAGRQCSECHKGTTVGASPDCFACHQQNYNQAPNHLTLGYPHECTQCHDVTNWEKSEFDHNKTSFPLSGQHNTTTCGSCHTSGFAGTPKDCNSCHTKNYNQAANPNHSAAGIPVTCESCHTPAAWAPSLFNHTNTGFALDGAHAGRQCSECHKGTTVGASPDCFACHQQNYNQAPNHLTLGYPHECTQCHDVTNWEKSEFDHNKTSFPLSGQHNTTTCGSCHTSGFAGTPKDCNSCHTKNYNQAANPNHSAAGIPVTCESCHTPAAWAPSLFNHTNTGFALDGAHAGRQCSECHKGTTVGASPDCFACHQQNYNQAPNHLTLGYPHECTQCHDVTNWEKSEFDHNKTSFPLTGQHTSVTCALCHTSGFAGTPKDCNNCHSNDYSQAANPSHTAAGIPVTCESCHTSSGWVPSTFNHTNTGFTLDGAHAGRQCSECHVGTTVGASPDCFACHQQNYNQAPNHLSQSFPTNCTMCHSTSTWGSATFDHNKTGFPLTGQHTSVTCALCHTSGFAGTPKDCNNCHSNDYSQAANPSHTAAGIPVTCESCHTSSGWVPSTFNHTNTGFTLDGAHAGRQCSECHVGTTVGASPDCFACHQQNYNQAPNHLSQSFPTNCTMCHSTSTWGSATFDHNKTGFPLTGQHTSVTCALCHTSGFAGTPKDCKSCHTNDYSMAANPSHTAAGIPVTCESCHTPVAWAPSSFNHTNTGFALDGAHAGRQCSECHVGTTVGASPDCFACHQQNYNQAANPSHTAAGIPVTCESCHTPAAWAPSTFNHTNTGFALDGAHAGRQCSECHVGTMVGASPDCFACHQQNYNQAPNHLSQSFPTNCTMCHSTSTWGSATFDHNKTGFPLTGQHTSVTCALCHTSGFAGTPKDCNNCHSNDYSQAANPSHTAAGIPVTCESCHTSSGWVPSTFNHTNTGFTLDGAHAGRQCSECHVGTTVGASPDCFACHQQNYNQAANPSHTAAGIPVTCESCHTASGWAPSSFNHTNTGFALDGAHAGRQCSECHVGTTVGASPDCFACHQLNYNQAPNHLTQSFPTNCTMCHSTRTWGSASFDHNATSFPLTGAHVATECSACHTSGFAGTSTDCATCHTSNYNQAANPNHTSLGLSTNCRTCHTTNPGWEPATFPVHNTFYALNGAHATVANDCYLCHNGNYTNTPNTCYGCHASDYTNAKDPNHLTAQFPTNCSTCHSENAWSPSTFNHDSQYFPIYSGKHQGEWNSCTDCHYVPSNYATFSCIICHEHNNAAELASDHREVNGYVYNATSCYNCHPTGRAD